jgi:pimeloyl-ACP methyl ester carboxylesterase
MGGKVAMQFALSHPERIDKLIVVDISPVQYPPHHHAVIEAIQSMNPLDLKDRSEAEAHLRTHLEEDEDTIQFLLKNLSRRQDAGFEWKPNMPVIIAHYDDLMAGITGSQPFNKPTLFVRGGLSNSLKDEDWSQISQLFPQAQLITIANAGHWVHADQPGALIDAIEAFMES